ncbi:hypothetical protein EAH68_05925 [Corynebacterium hylobatis]|uniref:Uncharacterized protein n=1 Tax=Corynebacterium hylobatis TaxID=1859290 RepID=A0A430HYX5_9CORY|nr:hypothetical protein [Corynebacterium hylobatis]RSZ63775.1 hypothetical protein EAH68_05925 [Corynebacterium hylobatis]
MSSYRLQPAADHRWWWSLFGITTVILLLPTVLLPVTPTRSVVSDVRLGMVGYSWSIPLDLTCRPDAGAMAGGWTCGSVSVQTMIAEGGTEPDRTLRRMMRALIVPPPEGAEILREGQARMLIDERANTVGMSLEGSGENEGLAMVAVLTGPGDQIVPIADMVWEGFTGQGLPEIVKEAIATPLLQDHRELILPRELVQVSAS